MIETYHLSKLYSRGVYALRDLSLTIDKGEFIFLTGPSGAGKSTLLRLLLREELPSEGDLKVARPRPEESAPSQVQSYRRTRRLRVPGLPADSALHRLPERRVRDARARRLPLATQQRKTFQVLKWVGLQHRMNALSRRAVGRRAAAHRDRARARQRPAARAGRRADRQPRSRSVARDHEPVPRDQRPRHDRRRRHARSRADSPRRPPGDHARSRAASWRSPDARASATRSTKRAISLWRGRQAGLLSTATIALALFVLGGFLLVTANLSGSAPSGATRPRCRST